jgi:hypothetical protein
MVLPRKKACHGFALFRGQLRALGPHDAALERIENLLPGHLLQYVEQRGACATILMMADGAMFNESFSTQRPA